MNHPVVQALQLEPASVRCASCHVLDGSTAFSRAAAPCDHTNCGEAAAVQANPARIMAMLEKSCTSPLHPLRSFGRVPQGPRRPSVKNVILDVSCDLWRFQACPLVARAGAAGNSPMGLPPAPRRVVLSVHFWIFVRGGRVMGSFFLGAVKSSFQSLRGRCKKGRPWFTLNGEWCSSDYWHTPPQPQRPRHQQPRSHKQKSKIFFCTKDTTATFEPFFKSVMSMASHVISHCLSV